MNNILSDFHNGNLHSKQDLEMEIEHYERIVQEYIDDDVYEGDSYYQDYLQTLEALKEALSDYDTFYDSDGNFKNQ